MRDVSYTPKRSTEVHYVLDIRVQRIAVTTVESQSLVNTTVDRVREVTEVAHYVVTEAELAAALIKGVKLLKLTGEAEKDA